MTDYNIEFQEAKREFAAQADQTPTRGDWLEVALILPALSAWVYAIVGAFTL